MKKLIFALLVSSSNLLVLFPLRAQPQAVEQPDHRKNYYNCLHGYSGSDSSLLTDAEPTQVRQPPHHRNSTNPSHPYSPCDPPQLPPPPPIPPPPAAHPPTSHNH